MSRFKPVLKCTLFLSGLLAILLVSGFVFKPKDNMKESGIEDFQTNGIRSEKENTIDVLILGDSLSYAGIAPIVMYQDYGITSYVCGSSGQQMFDTYRYLKIAFETQKPKYVILETDALYRKFDVADSVGSDILEALPVFRYHDRWKQLELSDFKGEVNYTAVNDHKGYRYNDTIKGIPNRDYMIETTDIQDMTELSKQYFDEIATFCKENGAELILLSVPSVKNCNYKKHNAIQKLADKYGVEFINMNLMKNEVPIDWEVDTRDKGDHLNHTGATKVTSYLGKYLFENKDLEDHRMDEKYSHWNKSLEEYLKTIQTASK